MIKSWYVVIKRGNQFALMDGPFATRAEAEAKSEVAKWQAEERWPETWFDIWGVGQFNTDRPGKLTAA